MTLEKHNLNLMLDTKAIVYVLKLADLFNDFGKYKDGSSPASGRIGEKEDFDRFCKIKKLIDELENY